MRARETNPDRKAPRRPLRKLVASTAVVCGLLASSWFLLPKPPPLEDVSYSRRVFDRDGRLLRMTLTADEKFRLHTPLDQIAPDLVKATLLHEDRHFWNHCGVNPVSAARSAAHVFLGHGGRGGASTITMQLARMRYRISTRSPRGKLLQMYRALQLERHFTKTEILEAYLNLAPYGRNIEGIGAASLLNFGKEPDKLTLHEAVALSVIPQSPTRRALRAGTTNPALNAAKLRLYARMENHDSLHALFEARSENCRPSDALHFVRGVLRDHPSEHAIKTTLDLDLQHLLERRIGGYIDSASRLGVSNAAAMLVDFQNMEVLAQAGSAHFFDAEICGQIDGTQSRRSPGSTLKPFIYALAFDQGLIHPLTVLSDAPRSFGGYNPENFDGEFAGPIRADDALARSRNIPAVALASKLGSPNLYELLKQGGVNFPHGESFYGLSLPLGGGEITMEELVRLYCALANGGRLRPLRRALSQPPRKAGTRLISAEAAFLTLEILGKIPRPGTGEPAGHEGIFWKTGTSHGFRDAWSIAVFDRYVLAVWIGNFDGRRNPAFVGRTCAGPLLFQIIDAIRSQKGDRIVTREPPSGANLQRVEFCAVSGALPTAACSHRESGWFIPGISPINACEVHREVLVDAQTGLRVATDDGTRAPRREVYEFWPSDLLALFEKAGLPRRRPPPFMPWSESAGEMITRSGNPPRITSPQHNQTYAAGTGDRSHGAIALKAQADADVAKLYWFAGRAFLGATAPREAIEWRPAPGSYQIVALDDQGRIASCAVKLQSTETR